MIRNDRLTELLDLLMARGFIHEGQKADVLNRGRDQARHILLDKRAEMRRLLGRHRVEYRVTETELAASFRFKRQDSPEDVLDEERITRTLADHVGLPFVHLDPLQLDYKLVTEAFGGPFAERHLVIAIDETPDSLTVAVADPWDDALLRDLARFKNKTIHPVLAEKSRILQVIVEFHGFRRSMRKAEEDFQTDLPDLSNLEQLYSMDGGGELDGTDQPIVRAVWYLLNYAFEQRASDIHLEPKRDEGWVRMRIDGVLHTIHRLPKLVHPAMVSRVKMLARLDIAERRRPQDGRFKTSFKQAEVELRVSSVPTAFGEKIVIRVFDPGVLIQDIENLGFFQREMLQWRHLLASSTMPLLLAAPAGQ